MMMKKYQTLGIAIATLTLFSACSTANKNLKVVDYATIDDENLFVSRVIANTGELLVDIYRALSPKLAEEFLVSANKFGGSLERASIQEVAAKLKANKAEAKFLKQFESLHPDFYASITDSEVRARAENASVKRAKVGNTEKASDVSSQIQGVSNSEKEKVIKMIQHYTYPHPGVTAEQFALQKEIVKHAVHVYKKTGIMPLTIESCGPEYSVAALKNVSKNQQGARELSDLTAEKYPTDLKQRAACFIESEAGRFFDFVEKELLNGADQAAVFENMRKLIIDCAQEPKALLAVLDQWEASGVRPNNACK